MSTLLITHILINSALIIIALLSCFSCVLVISRLSGFEREQIVEDRDFEGDFNDKKE